MARQARLPRLLSALAARRQLQQPPARQPSHSEQAMLQAVPSRSYLAAELQLQQTQPLQRVRQRSTSPLVVEVSLARRPEHLLALVLPADHSLPWVQVTRPALTRPDVQ